MTHPLFDITGKLALVTGSSRGIGLALARGLLEAGAVVILNARTSSALDDAARRLREETGVPGEHVRTAAFDVTDPDAVRNAVADIVQESGPIEILVNNAGRQLRAPLLEFEPDDWNSLVATNLTSAFLVSREVGRSMAKTGGKIVNIASLQSEVTRPGIAPYSATKGGLKMLTKGMCADLAGYDIQVNAIGPGYFATELTAPLVEDPQFTEWVESRTPAGRWGNVQDLIGTLIYLVSPASDFVNGQTIYVDGGMLSVL